MKTIVALVDHSDLTFKVLKHAHQQATAFHSEVIILHIVAKEPVVIDVGLISPTVLQEPSAATVQQHYAQLLEMRDTLIKFGVTARVEQLAGASIDTVLAEIQRLRADLLILGSHQHSTLFKLLIGSVTDDLLRRAHCPILLVPGEKEAPAN